MLLVGTADSAAIRATRVICIFLMMSVHLVPGPSGVSFVTHGPGAPIGDVWLGYFGRASVATLSLVSGFLVAGSFGCRFQWWFTSGNWIWFYHCRRLFNNRRRWRCHNSGLNLVVHRLF